MFVNVVPVGCMGLFRLKVNVNVGNVLRCDETHDCHCSSRINTVYIIMYMYVYSMFTVRFTNLCGPIACLSQ